VDHPLLRSPSIFPIESLAKSSVTGANLIFNGTRPSSPKWVRGAAKLLDAGFDGEDWKALAELLGYRNHK
jgi:hypothetical protein